MALMFRLAIGLFSIGCFAGPSFVAELWIRDDFLKTPKSAHLAGAYAQFAHSDASLALGILPVAFPAELPEARGPLLFNPLPSYSHRGGLSEWGKGFDKSLRIENFAEAAETNCNGNLYLSPWGQLRESDEKNVYYPKGLEIDLRVVKTSNGFTAYHPDGTIFEFTRAYGRLAWYLTYVKSKAGYKSVFEYTQNSLNRPLLSKIKYGGKNNAQYEVEIRYDKLKLPLKRYGDCGLETTIESRVHEIEIRHWNGSTFEKAKLLRLIHDGVYLSKVEIEFPSKERLPDINYHYGKFESIIAKTYGRVDPQFGAATRGLEQQHFFSKHVSYVDYNQDGLPDFERATDLKSFLQTSEGKFEPYQDFYVANRDGLCPPSGTYNKLLAGASRRRLFIRPAGISDTLFHLRLASDSNSKGSLTKIIVCSLEGQVAYQKEVFSALESAMSFELSTHLADLNGDLKPDLIKLGNQQYTYILNASTKEQIRFEDKVTVSLPEADNRWVKNYAMVDFNLDGFVDIVGQVHNGIMVWYGKGNQVFGPANHFFTLTTPEGWKLDVPNLHIISWVDVNRDGLVDLVGSLSGNPIIFIQGGNTLLEQRFPHFKKKDLVILNTYRVINLSAGGNDQLATLDLHLGHLYFDLNEPATGLLTRIENNQGISMAIGYDWTKPQEGVPQLIIVPQSLDVSTSGKENRSTTFEFANADIDSKTGQLAGFQHVKTMSPHGSHAISFLTSSDFAPRVQLTTKIDKRVDISQIERNDWQESVINGFPVLQLVHSYQAYVSKGIETLRRSLAFANYNRLCPQEILEKTPDGELTRDIRYSSSVNCQKISETLKGRHYDRADLDFAHAYEIKRDQLDLPLSLELLSDSERIIKTSLTYDANSNLKQVHQASTGPTLLEYDPLFEILKSLTEPDGTTHEISRYDAMADGMSGFATRRPNGQNLTQSFGYDGFGRMNRNENNWSTTLLSYQFPNQTAPGLVSDSLTGVTSIVAGDGAVLTQARERQNGFVYTPLHRWISAGATEQEIDLSKNHQDPRQLSFESLTSNNAVLSEREHSDLFGVLSSKQVVNHEQTRYLTRRTEANSRELQTTVTENSLYSKIESRSFRADESAQTTNFQRDMLERLREIKLPSGEAQKISLDDFGRTERIVRSNVGEISYAYDNVHDRISRRNFLGEEEAFEYDAVGRLKKRDGYEFEYEGERLTQVNHADFTKQFTYAADGLSLKKSLIEHKLGTAIEIEFEYNAARDVTEQKVNYRGTYTKRFNYNQHRELQSIVVGQAVFEIERNEVGKVSKIKLPQGKELNVKYDPLTWQRIGYDIPNVARYQWRLNSRGLIDQSEFVPSNRKAQRFSYAYRPDQTLKSRFSLDNPFDFLEFNPPEIPTSYVQAMRPKGVYDENRHLLAKYHDSKLAYLQFAGVSADAKHVYEKLTIEGIDVGILVDGQFRLTLFDQVGSIIADGDFVSIPSPFGERQHSLAIGEHFDFAGHGRDQETSLISMGERDYDSNLRRFTSPDRFYLENSEECVRSPQECDLYSYARNNPVINTDSSGQYVETALDVAFIGLDIYELYQEPSWINLGALGLDVVGTALPFVTGLGKAFKAVNKIADAKAVVKEVSHGKDVASNVANGKKLAEYLKQAEKYGEAGTKELQNGRTRFYGSLKDASKPGDLAGGRLVREWDSASGAKRTWYEVLDHSGNVRSVAPKPATNSQNHHIFDLAGDYLGRR